MKYEMRPVVHIDELETALNLQYGLNCRGELASFLFGDDYVNDSYKRFYFEELEIFTGKSWQDEEQIRMTNCVKSILQDTFPEYTSCLIDVSW